jgi:hypothetical protein
VRLPFSFTHSLKTSIIWVSILNVRRVVCVKASGLVRVQNPVLSTIYSLWSCGETLDSALLSQLSKVHLIPLRHGECLKSPHSFQKCSKFIIYLSFRKATQKWVVFHLARRQGTRRRDFAALKCYSKKANKSSLYHTKVLNPESECTKINT